MKIEINSGRKYLVRDSYGYITEMEVEMITNTTYLIRWKGKTESIYLSKATFGEYGKYDVIEELPKRKNHLI